MSRIRKNKRLLELFRKLAHGLRQVPFWAALVIIASMLFKLYYLDGRLNVGEMTHWKWKVNIGALLVATCWTALLGPRARMVALAGIDLLLSLVILADLVYFRYFKDFITVPVLLQANQVSSLGDSISNLTIYKDVVYFADLPFVGLYTLWLFRSKRHKHAPLPGSRAKRLATGALTGITAFVIGWQLLSFSIAEQRKTTAAGLLEGNWWNVPIYNVTGLFGFHGYDVYRYAKENWPGKALSGELFQDTLAWMDERRALQRQTENEPLFGAYKGKNVIIVQAEALSSFVVNLEVGGEPLTPNLNRLIAQSVYFPNFYHQTGSGRTADADFVSNCSLHPASSGSVFIRFAGNAFDCLPLTLKAENYGTTAHHAYEGSFWNRNNMYHNMRYDYFYTLKDYTIDEPIGWSLGDRSFFRQTVQQIRERGHSPFFAMVITLTSHHPYYVGDHGVNTGSLEGTTLGHYLQAVRYVDGAVGALVEELKQAGLWEDTILVFYGDHDNSISDWDDYEQLFGRPLTALEQERLLKQVPFFIHLPHDAHAGVREKAVGQIDVAPTLYQLLGISTQSLRLMGVSMMSDVPKQVVFRNGAFTDGKYYFVPGNEGIIGQGDCYDLESGKTVEPSVCRPGAETARHELAVSDRILNYNLLPRLKEGQ
jgi:phosphoglycerol transferase MdoB-like AlkP superfamily enzyme